MKTPLLLLALLLPVTTLADKLATPRELAVAKPEEVGMSTERLAKVDAKVAELLAQKRLAGAAVMVTRKGKLVYDKRFGLRDLENKKPIEADTIFRIFSMSKAMTSAVALMLSEEGKINLDDPIAKFIPEFKEVTVWQDGVAVAPKRPPTVRDLLCHTTGYSYGTTGIEAADKAYAAADPFSKDKTLAQMAASMAKVPLAFQPGSRWMYGVSTDLLGRVVEVASGLPFELLLEKRLFIPLDLPDTSFALDPAKADRLAVVYSSDRNGNLKNAGFDDFRYRKESKLPSGGGGLLSTVRDYTRFLQMIANGGELHGVRLMKPETVNLMMTNQLSEDVMPITFGPLKRHGTGFGLGFSVKVGDTDWNPEAPLGEYGWGGLLSTHYWISPKDELVIVTMEQTIPYDFLLENELKPLIYAALDQ